MRVNAQDLVRMVDSGPAWCLNLDVISPASRRAPGFGAFLEGRSELRVTYSDMEAGGKNHRVAKPREMVVVKDDGGDPGSGAVVGLGEITANYHNPENPFLKISLKTKLDSPITPAEVRAAGGDVLGEVLERPILFEIIE